MSLRSNPEKLENSRFENDAVYFKPLTTERALIYAAFECQLTEEQKALVNPA